MQGRVFEFARAMFVMLVALSAITACAGGTPASLDESLRLRQAMAGLRGNFVWRSDAKTYEYSQKQELEKILSGQTPQRAVKQLIECLDDTRASSSVLDGRPVALGIVCYEALTQLVYYEPTDDHGDVVSSWVGFLSPRASLQEMRDAKAAWGKAESAKQLVFQ